MNYELRKLSISDDMDIYEMLQEIPKDENSAVNPINGKTFEEFKQWLIRSDSFQGEGISWLESSN